MSLKKLQDILDDFSLSESDGKIRIQFGDLTTNWMSSDDPFIERISPENLNEFFPARHLEREIEIRNILDEGIGFLNDGKYARAIGRLDCVICYDDNYSQALINKSYCLYGQKHFVKALRFYKKSGITDVDYYKLLLRKSSEERDSFPKIKRDIYAGDEASSEGDFNRALDFYEMALENPSKFKNKILFKLLNKKAFALIGLLRFDEALASFDSSIGVHENDAAYFGRGFCQYELGFDCVESLDNAKKIDKKSLLKKAVIFNDLECFDKALVCFDEFLDSHFALDDDFKKAVAGKVTALQALGKNCMKEMEILRGLHC